MKQKYEEDMQNWATDSVTERQYMGLIFHPTADEDNPCQSESCLSTPLTSGIKQHRKDSSGTRFIMADIQNLIPDQSQKRILRQEYKH